jgi:D-alanyl-D-alanine carboxypeptidase
MSLMETPTPTKQTSVRLAKLKAECQESKPRALIIDGDGNVAVNWGETTLPVILAGVTKLFTLAMVLREIDRGAMGLETPLGDLLPPETIDGLCVVRNIDYASAVTVEQLLSHRSGIVDYYEPHSKKTLPLRIQSMYRDRAWSDAQALEIARHYPAVFAPGPHKKVHLSSTNYLLLGQILQASTGMTFDQLISLRVTGPLGLKKTVAFTSAHYETYFSIAPLHLNQKPLRVPRTLASFGPVGSIISTARDMTQFLQAFARGELFSQEWTPYLRTPLASFSQRVTLGNGVMIPRSFGRESSLYGQSGSSGTAALIDSKTGAVGFLAKNIVGSKKDALVDLMRLMSTELGVSVSH